ncbi:MAG: alpha/beta fold hydrolase [Cyclobacteriaceae bacterium]|nr:alpha/beta fold hydrolase [Cyclobacteriaceae bacterium]
MQAYRAPALLFSSHIETIYPALLRTVDGIIYQRERISTPDNDFLDLDWLNNHSQKLVILSHGLEGNSHRAYMKGMARLFFKHSFDVLAWNYRGCSGEMNRQLRFYHSGATDDLNTVIQHAISKGYTEINLVGFSLGGNLALKYLGEQGDNLPAPVKRAVVFSVPLHLHSSSEKIASSAFGIYARRFLKTLKQKVALKATLMPGIDTQSLHRIHNLLDFDDAYTARLHGFEGAIDYYERCSSLYFLDKIKRPALLVNAANDPFLSSGCYPQNFAQHRYLKAEYPVRGGHVGFAQFNKNRVYWSELRALQFIQTGT